PPPPISTPSLHDALPISSIDVIPTASAVADVKINRLALVETQWILRVRVQGGAERQKCGGADCGHNAHVILLLRFYFRPCRRDVASSGAYLGQTGATLGRTAAYLTARPGLLPGT